VLQSVAGNQNLAFELLPYDASGGHTTVESLEKYRGEDITALVIQQPNFFGTLEDVDALTDRATSRACWSSRWSTPPRSRS